MNLQEIGEFLEVAINALRLNMMRRRRRWASSSAFRSSSWPLSAMAPAGARAGGIDGHAYNFAGAARVGSRSPASAAQRRSRRRTCAPYVTACGAAISASSTAASVWSQCANWSSTVNGVHAEYQTCGLATALAGSSLMK
jgi:hypothetical protein